MTEAAKIWSWLGIAFVAASWIAFLVGFLVMRRVSGKETKRAGGSAPGMLLQTLAVLLVGVVRRPLGTSIVGIEGKAGDVFLALSALMASILALISVWILLSAMHTLGKQFAIGPRVIEGHQLIVRGPYSRVRNPIYSGLLGLLLATGLAWSQWWAIVAGVAMYVVGVLIRIRVEEGLLRSVFGEDFDAYCRYVPALLPRLWNRK